MSCELNGSKYWGGQARTPSTLVILVGSCTRPSLSHHYPVLIPEIGFANTSDHIPPVAFHSTQAVKELKEPSEPRGNSTMNSTFDNSTFWPPWASAAWPTELSLKFDLAETVDFTIHQNQTTRPPCTNTENQLLFIPVTFSRRDRLYRLCRLHLTVVRDARRRQTDVDVNGKR